MLRFVSSLWFLVMFAGLTGCSAYLPDYNYVPRPALISVPATQPTDPPQMNVYATVIGIRRAEPDRPQTVDIRVHVENGHQTATVDPHAMQLVSGSLLVFPPPSVLPDTPVQLGPGEGVMLSAVFPFPPGFSDRTVDLTGLRLKVPVTIAGRSVQTNFSFQRMIPVYHYDPYPAYYGPRYYGGIYYHHRHRW